MKSYNKKVQRVVEKSKGYAEKLLNSKKYNLNESNNPKIPIEKGIYIFCFKDTDTGKIAYVGSATGKKGLRQRIKYEHLRPSYKKKNEEKSAFRKQVASNNTKLEIGEEVVDYIQKNFDLYYIKMDKETIPFIKLTELLFIRGFNPEYNTEGAEKNKKMLE